MSQAAFKKDQAALANLDETSYFTVFVGGEIFGLPVEHTHTIFRIAGVTSVPLGPGEVTGLVNLRGKIVTAVCLRRRLHMAAGRSFQNALAIGIEHKGENFALIVDEVGDVLALGKASEIPIPSHFDPQRARLTSKLYRTGKLLIPVLNIDALFTFHG